MSAKPLTRNQAQFFQLLKRAPYLTPLWDINKAEYIPDAVRAFLGTASRSEKIMGRFFLGVWSGKNEFDFDFTEAAAHLDDWQIDIITNWMTRPFWP